MLRTKNYNDIFALRANGESMNEAHIMGKAIYDGDFVIVDSSKITPRDGERVVVMRDDVANIKQIFFDHEEQVIILKSESSMDFNPIFINPEDNWDGLISGTVIQVIKTTSRNQASRSYFRTPLLSEIGFGSGLPSGYINFDIRVYTCYNVYYHG